jgi:hypothetical protein
LTIQLARLPRISIAYKTVPGNTADFYALQVLANVLGGGTTRRRNWCAEKRWANAGTLRGDAGVGVLHHAAAEL